jgi:hypothetical protein
MSSRLFAFTYRQSSIPLAETCLCEVHCADEDSRRGVSRAVSAPLAGRPLDVTHDRTMKCVICGATGCNTQGHSEILRAMTQRPSMPDSWTDLQTFYFALQEWYQDTTDLARTVALRTSKFLEEFDKVLDYLADPDNIEQVNALPPPMKRLLEILTTASLFRSRI